VAGRVGERTRSITLRGLHPILRRIGLALALIVVSLAGVGIALRLDGHVQQDVGPFSATFGVQPSLAGGTDVQIPPLGSLSVASHDGPAHMSLRLDSLDQGRATSLVTEPNGVQIASDSAVPDVEAGVTRLALQSTGVAMLGAMLLGALVFRRSSRIAICGGIALATIAASGGIAFATFRPASIEEPKYDGLLSNAPAVIGDAHSIADRFNAYRDELQSLVDNVSKLYGTVNSLPVYTPTPGTVRVLHISDLHLNPSAWSVIETVVTEFHIDVVIDTGDLDDWGTTVESSFVDSIKKLKVPYVYIRGNHDSEITAKAVAKEPNAIVLENQITTVDGLRIAGIGDPRFTPDKASDENIPDSAVIASGQTLASTIKASAKPVDIALVHDPASAGALDGTVPLVLAGHLHKREIYEMPTVPDAQKTLMMVGGSTGGAGLRGLQGETPTPLEMDVLYFDSTQKLQAYDEITLGGTGQSNVMIDRHLASQQPTPSPSLSPSSAPSPSIPPSAPPSATPSSAAN
jgi:predicted phosphodiesterase